MFYLLFVMKNNAICFSDLNLMYLNFMDLEKEITRFILEAIFIISKER